MHTEHLQNVRVVWVLVGWLVSVAVASGVALGFVGLGLVDAEGTGGAGWTALAVVIGFLVGGFATGVRVAAAPILHGVAMGLTSLVAWLVLNVAVSALFATLRFPALTAPLTLAYLLAQIVAAVLGTQAGYRFASRGAGGMGGSALP